MYFTVQLMFMSTKVNNCLMYIVLIVLITYMWKGKDSEYLWLMLVSFNPIALRMAKTL